jgi:hypothetical protein
MLTQNNVLTIVDFHLKKTKQKARRQNSIVLLKNGKLCSIEKIVLLESRDGTDGMVVLFGNRLECINVMSRTNKFQLMEYVQENEKLVFFPSHVKSKCVYLKKNGKYYLSVLSNLIDRD